MSNTIYNNNPNTIGYWLDEYNGITGRLGYFHILYLMSLENQSHPEIDYISYPTESGNPIMEWANLYESEPGVYRSKGIEYNGLDNLYIDRSGLKILRRRFVERMSETDPGVPFAPVVERITRKYSKKWLDLWETMFYDYEPLWNYDMTETLTDDVKEFEHGHVITLENGKKMTRSGSVTNTPGTTYTETQSIKGLDSTNWTESDKSVSAPSGSGDVTNYTNLADTASGTDTTRNQGTDTETRNYTLTRTGNIGVTTSMELIQKQRQVVMFNYFDQVVFPDIDKEIALKVY